MLHRFSLDGQLFFLSLISTDKTMTDILTPTVRTSVFRVIVWMTVGLGSSGVASFFAFGKTVTEKLITALVLPCGAIWVLLFSFSLLAFFLKNRTVGFLGLLAFAAYTVLGSGYLSNALAARIERPFRNIDPLKQEPFDKVILLGGGGSIGSNSRPQGNRSGDRLILAASLYHQGITPTVICTGTSIQGLGENGMGPGQVSAAVLQSLGVPADAIEFGEGRTTAEELANLKRQLGDQPQRIGIVTSAWHLSRALRLAEHQGLKLIPLPADFMAGKVRSRTNAELIKDCIPEADSLLATTALLKEHLAALVGR